MAQMTKRERLSATINGQEVDRIAVALWRHFPGDDQRPADLAQSQFGMATRIRLGLHQGVPIEQLSCA